MIYVNGGSVTDGTGLCDYQLIPNYPGNMKIRDIKIMNSWGVQRRNFLHNSLENYEMWSKMNYEKAWPNYAFKNYINNAAGGSSIFSICVNSIMDISNLLSRGIKITGICIDLPGFERLSLIKNNNADTHSSKRPKWIKSISPNHYHNLPKSLTNYFKESWSVRSSEDLLINALINISHLNSFTHDSLGFYPTYISSELNIEYCKTIIDNGVTDVGHYWLTQSRILDIDILLYKLHDTEFLADGHYDLEFHLKLGEYIKQKLNFE